MLKSTEILNYERKYDPTRSLRLQIFCNFAFGQSYPKNAVDHKIGKIAESYQSKTPKQREEDDAI